MPIFKNINDQFSLKENGENLEYWKSKLHGLEPLKLPKDCFGTFDKNGGLHKVFFPKDSILIENVKNSVEGSSILYTIIGSLQVLLYRYCSQNDFCIGLSLDGVFLSEFAKQNGFKIDLNLLPIRTQIGNGLTFDSIIQNTKEAVFEALENSNLSFEELINDLKNDPIKDFFFNVLCIIKKEHIGNDQKNKPNEKELRDFNANLIFEFEESDKYLNGSITFRSDVFGENFINRMIEHFFQLLDSIRISPNSKISELNILSQKEKSFLLESLNDTLTSFDECFTVLHLFENQVKNNPDAIALEFEGNQLTYEQLDSKSNQLAYYLKKTGLNCEDPVPICLDRSLEMIIAIFGIIKAGGAYVPIDPYFPADRIDYMIEDTGANIVICSTETSKNFGDKINRLIMDKDLEVINQMPISKVSPSPSPKNLVYIIYTSGSTGKPKGAMVEHRNLLNFVNSLSKIVEIDSSSIQLSITTYIFDAFCLELFVPLTVGAKVILVSKEVSMDGFKLAKALTKHKPTHMKATPSGWQLLLNAGWKNPEGIRMTTGGEVLGEETKNMLASTGKLWNLYGPTETTIDSTFKKMDVQERVTIGKPIDYAKIYILGPGGSLNPLGIPGELCIGGKGVGRGYLNRPELTAQKFVPDPFSDENDAVMYHSGDLARWLSDGNIEYLGRLDDQVKIRGYRIELGEIESVLQSHPSIKQAVVLAKESTTGGKRLVGYLVCNEPFDRNSVIAFLKSKLPDYMIPSQWMELENLPLSFSGKVDRKALCEIEIEHIQSENYEAPKTDLQKQLAAIWQKTLGLEKVGIQDDFFALGGHSLLAMKVMATIRSEMGIELSIREMFNFPTLRWLAEILESKGNIKSDLIPLDNSKRPEIIPLSYNQQSLWFIHQLSGSTQYHIPLIFRIEGELYKQALRNALVEIVNRHEILRTVISEKDGVGFQKILNKNQFKLDEKEINNKDIDKEITKLIRVPFDLNNDHMIRACLIKSGIEKYNLVITMHHIASDGWSVYIIKNELRKLYSSFSKREVAHLPGLPYQYADYALWQRNLTSHESFQTNLDYWKNKLQNIPPLQLPTDYTRPSVLSTNGDIHRFTIDSNLVSQLNEIGKSQKATLFMTLLAAYKILLHRYSGQEDICVGTPIAGRERNETEDLIGFFVNTLPQRTQIKASMGFDELLKEVKSSTLEVIDHQRVPFEVIVETMGQERDLSRNPVFQVLFVLQNFPDLKFQIEGAEVTEESFEHFTSQFDMTMELKVTNEGIEGVLEFCTDLFKKETISNFVSHYLELLKSICINPLEKIGMLKIIPIDVEKKLLESFNPTQKTFPENI
ncbi:amino acid adenylation domain-containing protein, partial [Aquiflexum sp.]|uniref:amino acid adenylation domain-containing protein n=1 Tax=Aquiflexum sp. TaxID=1872584 RepID=UPI0035948275